jgi:inorganic pyrophosphatase
MPPLSKLPPIDRESGDLNVIIDTLKGSQNKFSWDKQLQLFELSGVLPAGAVSPYDFGFIPNTRGEDGDELDVLVLMDEPAFTGCLVRSRMLGVIEAEQTEKGKTNHNDRLIAVASKSRAHADVKSISDMNPNCSARSNISSSPTTRRREEVQAARAIWPGAGVETRAAWETQEKTLTCAHDVGVISCHPEPRRRRGTLQLQIAAHCFKDAVNVGPLL